MYSPVSRVRVFFPHGAPRRPPAGRERIGAVKGVRRPGPIFLYVDPAACARAATGVRAAWARCRPARGLTREVTGHRCAAVRRACPIGNAHDSVGCVDWMRAGAGGAPPDLSRTSRDVGRPDRSSHTLRLPLMAPRAVVHHCFPHSPIHDPRPASATSPGVSARRVGPIPFSAHLAVAVHTHCWPSLIHATATRPSQSRPHRHWTCAWV